MSADGPPATRTRSKIHAARLALINGYFNLPDNTPAAMKVIRAAVAKAAERVLVACETVRHDGGRVTAVLDAFQMIKNVACDATIIPHHDRPAEGHPSEAATAADKPAPTRSPIHAARLALIKNEDYIPEGDDEFKEIHFAISEGAESVLVACESVTHDPGRVTAVLDQFVAVKHMAWDAILLVR